MQCESGHSGTRPRRTKQAAVVLISLLLMACDQQKISELEEGVSTEAAVRKRFGEPAAIYQEPNGDKTLEYPRQPAGHVNYMISIGPDGKMSALRQVLTLANFRRVQLGLDQQQVRHMLGRPARSQRYALKQEEEWDWRFSDGQEIKIFSVTFDSAGRVIATGITGDPKELEQLGK
jgi:hypothetical protein